MIMRVTKSAIEERAKLFNRLIEERDKLLEACKKALTCQASMNSDVVEVIRKAVSFAETP